MRILAIGAHPDDCDLCFAGTAVKLARAGHQVKFISATNGDTGHHIIGGGQLARRRYNEVQKAAKIGNLIEYEVFDIHNNGIQPDIQTRERFIKAIRDFSPDILLTHRTCDYHPDHRITAQLVQDSSYAIIIPNVCPLTPPMKKPPVILYFSDNFKRPSPFTPEIVVDISDSVDTKIEMFKCQESQIYEWLAYADGEDQNIPEEGPARDKWIREKTSISHSFSDADKYREELIKKYGEQGKNVVACEAFELSEYGRRPEGELNDLFGF
ncbi:MAG: PIG-L family deacetylase [Ruminococcaceae bacterium]|nr:PIG-L family deacetylase [Oscillospiraceae bacterium]